MVEKPYENGDPTRNYNHLDGLYVAPPFFVDNRTFRYKIEIYKPREIEGLGETLCVILQNPSYADETRADKSINIIEKVVFEKDYKVFDKVDHIVIVNQFAYVQTKNFYGDEGKIGVLNDYILEREIKNADIILIGWGLDNHYSDRKKTIKKIIFDNQNKNKKIYITSMHPCVVKYDDYISEYDEEKHTDVFK